MVASPLLPFDGFHYTYVFLNCKYFFVESKNICRVSDARNNRVVLYIPLVLARPVQRARARFFIYAPASPAPIAQRPCVFKLYVCCDFRPPSLCFRECNNTIALNLKTNSVQKGYSLNTHKPKTNPKIFTSRPKKSLHPLAGVVYCGQMTYNSHPIANGQRPGE